MKSTRTVKYIGVFLVTAIIMTCCTREVSDKEKKEEAILALVNEVNADSLENDVIWLQNMGNRFCFSGGQRKIANKIRNRFIGMGYENTVLDSFIVARTFREVYYEQMQYNVIATLEGTEYPDSVSVLGGHYDNILKTGGDLLGTIYGANDNASGVAGVLETARVMKKNAFSPAGTIMFIAFGAEEVGLCGSKDFAVDPNGYYLKIRFMLNFDMIACENSSDPANWYVNIMDYNNSHKLRTEAEAMVDPKYTLLESYTDNTSHNYSDSYSFYLCGYKALFFFSGDADPNYHTLNDIAANYNFDYCAEVVKVSCALMADKNWVPGN